MYFIILLQENLPQTKEVKVSEIVLENRHLVLLLIIYEKIYISAIKGISVQFLHDKEIQ
jgi:hypothetical protein